MVYPGQSLSSPKEHDTAIFMVVFHTNLAIPTLPSLYESHETYPNVFSVQRKWHVVETVEVVFLRNLQMQLLCSHFKLTVHSWRNLQPLQNIMPTGKSYTKKLITSAWWCSCKKSLFPLLSSLFHPSFCPYHTWLLYERNISFLKSWLFRHSVISFPGTWVQNYEVLLTFLHHEF